ncbi:MAG TPA: hypothetical protein VJY15_09205 [Candidatus Acidoferrum sp.]|nr:hypothetical protein [Candidatus Acidoferrum sp.]
MSTEPQKNGHGEAGEPVHDDVSFETRDLRPSPILKFLMYLGITIILSYGLALLVYRGLTHHWQETYTAPPPSRGNTPPTMPPEPRLQEMPGHLSDPQKDWRDKVKADTEANNQLLWIDRNSGIAQIPVSEAMKLISEKGLPAVHVAPAEKKK